MHVSHEAVAETGVWSAVNIENGFVGWSYMFWLINPAFNFNAWCAADRHALEIRHVYSAEPFTVVVGQLSLFTGGDVVDCEFRRVIVILFREQQGIVVTGNNGAHAGASQYSVRAFFTFNGDIENLSFTTGRNIDKDRFTIGCRNHFCRVAGSRGVNLEECADTEVSRSTVRPTFFAVLVGNCS